MAVKAAHGWWARRRPLTLGAPTRPAAAKCRTPPRGLPRRGSRSASRASLLPSACCSSSTCSSSTARPPGPLRRRPRRAVPLPLPGANASIAADLRALTAGLHLAGRPGRRRGPRMCTRDSVPRAPHAHPRVRAVALVPGARLPRAARRKPLPPCAPPRRTSRRTRTAASCGPYHAYSPSGAAVAEAVFVNLGREEDLAALDRLGMSARGRVAVAVPRGWYRDGVVARAAGKGAVAVLIPGHADDGVERGAVLLGGPGDPLTPRLGRGGRRGAARVRPRGGSGGGSRRSRPCRCRPTRPWPSCGAWAGWRSRAQADLHQEPIRSESHCKLVDERQI
ncbi:putative glutamate carboxypeptidase 2 [Hordeum vulgare]|nr:putative glutamate carboxypeptidase 2 [Hordeum vulgare]